MSDVLSQLLCTNTPALQPMRLNLLVLLLSFVATACTRDDSTAPTMYLTDGTAKLQVCKGIGLEKCEYEPAEIPARIGARHPFWETLRSERKSSTLTMCYVDQPGDLFTKRKLMFECEPVHYEAPDASPAMSQEIQDQVIPSLTNLAEAAATFEVCAFDSDIEDEAALEWARQSLAVTDIATRLTDHYPDDRLYLAFEMLRVKMYESDEFKSETFDYTNNCNAESLSDAEQVCEGLAAGRRACHHRLEPRWHDCGIEHRRGRFMPNQDEQQTGIPQALQTVADADKAVAISAAVLECCGQQFETKILRVDYTGRFGRRGPFRRFAEIRFTLNSAAGAESQEDEIQALQAVSDDAIAEATAARIAKMTGETYLGFVAMRKVRTVGSGTEVATIDIQLAVRTETD